jgi:regulator of nucleoside diphosphate kinase
MNRKLQLGDPPAIRLTRHDLNRLDALLSALSNESPVAAYLQREVDRAAVVADDDPARFVRLGSRTTFADEAGRRYTGTVGFPGELAQIPDVISVLTPVGAALLGLGEGQSITYETPDRRIKSLTVVEVLATR